MTSSDTPVIRVPLAWFAAGAVLILLLGMAGGILANQIWPPVAPPGNDQERIVPTVQQVTISPDTAAASSLALANRAVVHLAVRQGESWEPKATGTVLTNDGVIITPAVLKGEVAAIDYQGVAIPLDTVGVDSVYGLQYFRLRDGVLAPLDLRSDPLPVGWELLLAGRSLESPEPYAASFRVQEYALPPELGGFGPGVRRLVRGQPVPHSTLRGAPLLDSDGRLAAILLNPDAGLALTSEHIRESLQRLAAHTREQNLFADIGFTPVYRMTPAASSVAPRFVMAVETVAPHSPASGAGLQAGDLVIAIGGQDLAWDTDIPGLLAGQRPLVLTVQRDGTARSLNIPTSISTTPAPADASAAP